ncbi:MAG TPA: class I SAM-dependent methyltransferase [Burkholderiales bacterium]|nr:class I SAM-dependent methyltransferase [Burkholderiales bacterium]
MARESDVERELRAATSRMAYGAMQISPDQAALLALLVRLVGARRAIEIGTFTGYSALAIAGALPADGKLIACDVSAEWTKIARRAWKDAGLADRIELHLAPAERTLRALVKDAQAGKFDFAFIDADKESTDVYYELCLTLVRAGGLIAIDNALSSGRVANPRTRDPDARAMRAVCLKIRDDARVDCAMVGIRDGLLLARKR